MVVSEWWCWEAVGLAASLLGPTTLAAQSVVLTISSSVYQVPFAFAAGAAVRTGNLLGAGQDRLARIALYAALLAAMCVSIVNVAIMVGGKEHLGKIFTNEPEVLELVSQIVSR